MEKDARGQRLHLCLFCCSRPSVRGQVLVFARKLGMSTLCVHKWWGKLFWVFESGKVAPRGEEHIA